MTISMTYSVPLLNPITKRTKRNARILDKVRHNLLAQPPTIRILEHQRRVPVVQSNRRLDTILNASINDIVVVIDSQLIDGSSAERQDA